jgi:hypothetical protein
LVDPGVELDDRGEELLLEPGPVERVAGERPRLERVAVEAEELLLDPNRERVAFTEAMRNHGETLGASERSWSEARAGGRASDRYFREPSWRCGFRKHCPLG